MPVTPRVKALSDLLQSPTIHPAIPCNPDFRNPAGVAFKTYNIASAHPAYRGTQSNGNRLDKQVLDYFSPTLGGCAPWLLVSASC
jgi:5-methylcytosine-specific restriction protein A